MQLISRVSVTIFFATLALTTRVESSAFQTFETANEAFMGLVKDSDGESGIWFSGDPCWLTSQLSPKSRWHELKNVSFVSLSHTSVTKEEIAYIATLKNIKSLYISCESECIEIKPGALEPLSEMTWLKRLHLVMDDGMDDQSLQFLSNLKELDDLLIAGTVGMTAIRRIFGLKNLRELVVLGMDIPEDSSGEVSALVSNQDGLRSVQLGNIDNVSPMLNGLKGSKIKLLSLKTSSLTSEDVGNIVSLTELQNLFIGGTDIGSISEFSKLKFLKCLRLNITNIRDSGGCSFLSELPELETLEFLQINAGQFSLDSLRGHKKLTKIIVPSAELAISDLEILSTMPALRHVSTANLPNSEWRSIADTRLPNVIFGQN